MKFFSDDEDDPPYYSLLHPLLPMSNQISSVLAEYSSTNRSLITPVVIDSAENQTALAEIIQQPSPPASPAFTIGLPKVQTWFFHLAKFHEEVTKVRWLVHVLTVMLPLIILSHSYHRHSKSIQINTLRLLSEMTVTCSPLRAVGHHRVPQPVEDSLF